MAINTNSIDDVIRSAVADPAARPPSDLPDDVRQKIQQAKGYDDLVRILATDARIDEATAHHMASTTLYATVAKSGLNPINWFPSLPIGEQKKVRYGVTEYNQALAFFGSWSEIQKAFWIIGVLSGIAIVVLGIGPAITAAGLARTALLAGQGLAVASRAYDLGKVLALPRLVIPGIIGAVAWLGSLFAGAQLTATGDLLTYIPKGIADSEEKIAALAAKAAGSSGGGGFGNRTYPLTRITMATTAKPVVVIGTLFSSIVKRTDAFDRVPDDAITSASDLQADAQVNLNKWLASLPSRLIYTVNMASNPFDEFGNRQTGSWITLGIAIRSLAGKVTPLDTILLGPHDPVVYMPRSQEISTIQIELPKLLTAQELAEVRLPAGGLKTIGIDGTIVPVVLPDSIPPAFTPLATPVAAAAAAQAAAAGPAPAPIAATPGGFAPSGVIVPGLVSAEDYRERGLAVPPGVPARAFVQAQAAAEAELPPLGGPRGFRKGQVLAIVGTETCTNLREGAQLNRRIIVCLPNGTRVIADGWGGESDGFDWYRVNAGSVTGFVAGSHLVRTS